MFYDLMTRVQAPGSEKNPRCYLHNRPLKRLRCPPDGGILPMRPTQVPPLHSTGPSNRPEETQLSRSACAGTRRRQFSHICTGPSGAQVLPQQEARPEGALTSQRRHSGNGDGGKQESTRNHLTTLLSRPRQVTGF